jgi:urease subunit alpha
MDKRAAYGKARTASSVTFVSQAALDAGLRNALGVDKELVAVRNTRGRISKAAMIHNAATPRVEVIRKRMKCAPTASF